MSLKTASHRLASHRPASQRALATSLEFQGAATKLVLTVSLSRQAGSGGYLVTEEDERERSGQPGDQRQKVPKPLCLGFALSFLPILVEPAAAQTTFNLLKSFLGSDGAVPICTLVDGKDGAFYGPTAGGGISNKGAVFRIKKDGSGFGLLKSFVGADGATPSTGLVMSTNGSFFGTTYAGGTSNFGTVFGLDSYRSDAKNPARVRVSLALISTNG